MAEHPSKRSDTESDQPTTAEGLSPFARKLRDRIVDEFRRAGKFLEKYQDQVLEMNRHYNSARLFDKLHNKDNFPMPVIQEDVDQLVADLMDRIFFQDEPCRLQGFEQEDKQDAEVKREFFRWLDIEDEIKMKFILWLKDAALSRMCAATVQYESSSEIDWGLEPAVSVDGVPTAMEDLDEVAMAEAIAGGSTIEPTQVWELKARPVFQGAVTTRIDPLNIFFTQDKKSNRDKESIMVRSWQTKEFFDSEEYFFNQELIDSDSDDTAAGGKGRGRYGIMDEKLLEKMRNAGLEPDPSMSDKSYHYVESQIFVDRLELYQELKMDEAELEKVSPGEKTWAICGLVNNRTIVRMQEVPREYNGPTVIVGWLLPEEDSLTGSGFAEKIIAVQNATNGLMATLMSNFRQSVNAMWAIKTKAIAKKKTLVNKPGLIIETLEDPRNVVHRIEQPRVAPDIYTLLELFKQSGQDAGGMQNTLTGRTEPGAKTLGEVNVVTNRASLRISLYLKSFETSFILPLYRMRNRVNSMTDKTFRFKVLGDSESSWREIEPTQVRADVDFICEASERETNKNLMAQQLLTAIKVAPVAIANGQPIRIDRMLYDLGQNAWGWKPSNAARYFPLIAMELSEDGLGEQIDQQLAQNAMLMIQATRNSLIAAAMAPGLLGAKNGSGGAGLTRSEPRSTTEAEANDSLERKNASPPPQKEG